MEPGDAIVKFIITIVSRRQIVEVRSFLFADSLRISEKAAVREFMVRTPIHLCHI